MNTLRRIAREIDGAKYPGINAGLRCLNQCKTLIQIGFLIPG